ncbi:MAG: serine/threonine protein kinase [Acaryochloridaceae cyanobacterium SU_2_1]|nr:serine/threonine protein kinase [Acaryochloridaceae cyanobacterium SU_2_1]
MIKQLTIASEDPGVIAKSKELFQREAETLGKTGNHPHLPRLLDFFSVDQQFYLVQEYVEGPTLQEEIRHSGRFTEAKIWALLKDLLATLDYLHHQEIIHRDIKPTNIIRRTLDNKLILIDFGAVKERVHQSIGADLVMEPAPATMVGTAGFSPPEQMARRPVFASDLYSLGITCLYLLTGKAPDRFDYDQHSGELSWQTQVQISDALKHVLEGLLKVSVRDRYPSAQAAMADIEIQEQQLNSLAATVSLAQTVQLASSQAQTSTTQIRHKTTAKPVKSSSPQAFTTQTRQDFIQKAGNQDRPRWFPCRPSASWQI